MNGQKKYNQVKEWLRWSKELQIPWIHRTEQMPICQAERPRNIHTGVRNLADLLRIRANKLKQGNGLALKMLKMCFKMYPSIS